MPWNGMLAYSQRCYTALACYCVIGGVLSRTTSLHPWALCPTAHRLPPRFAPAYKTLLCFYRDKQRRVRKREGVGGGGLSSEAPQLSRSISSEGQAVIPEDAIAESLVGPAVLLPHTHAEGNLISSHRTPCLPRPFVKGLRRECGQCKSFWDRPSSLSVVYYDVRQFLTRWPHSEKVQFRDQGISSFLSPSKTCSFGGCVLIQWRMNRWHRLPWIFMCSDCSSIS